MKSRKKRMHSLRDLAVMKMVLRKQERDAKKIIGRSKKLARLVNLGTRDGADALKVMEMMLEFPEFMKELAVMTIDYGKHHHNKLAGF